MLTLAYNRKPIHNGSYPSNSPKLTVFMLSITILIAILLSYFFDFVVQAPSYFLLGLMLFPMSHFFNTYKSILEVRTIVGLNGNEIQRLNTTVNKRAENIIKIMIIYITIICLVAVLGVTDITSKASTLMLCIAVIVSALVDTVIAWKTLKEIRNFEQKLLMRVKRTEAREKIVNEANEI